MSTADKLSKLLETKEAIKQAIIDKGGTVGDVFADYPTAIQNIQTGSGTFVVPEGMRFAYSNVTEFPEDWDWSEVEQAADHSRRFYQCGKLSHIPKFKILNATDASYMFNYCSLFNEIDMSNWDLSKVTNTESMFSMCSKLRSVKWGEFNTRSNRNFRSIFQNCSTLQFIPELDCSSNTSTYSSYNSPLYGCDALGYFGGLKGINKSVHFSDNYCLSYESLLNIINGLADGVSGQTLTLHQDLVNQLSDDDIAIATSKGWSISPARTITTPVVVSDLSQIPSSTYAITSRTYDFSQYTGKLYSLPNKSNLRYFEGDLSNANVKQAFSSFKLKCAHLKTNIAGDTDSMFNQNQNLLEVTGLEGYTTNASTMFSYCRLLKSVDLSKLDTSQCTDMQGMFNCSGIEEIPKLNTSQCTLMSSMFSETNIITADLKGWDLSKVVNMDHMFSRCYNLQTVMMDSELNPNLSVSSMFAAVTTNGTFYYNPAYDYSKIIAALPATWTAVPLTE